MNFAFENPVIVWPKFYVCVFVMLPSELLFKAIHTVYINICSIMNKILVHLMSKFDHLKQKISSPQK